MGSIIGLFILWYVFWGKDNPDVYKKISGAISKFITLAVIMAIFGGLTGLLSAGFGLFLPVIPFLVAGGIIKSVIKDSQGDKKRQQSVEYKEIREKFKLTQSAAKRAKILKSFNKKYQLNLTDDQIETIMNASYMSYYWEKELYDMTKNYEVEAQWMAGNSAWLRAYLKAFPVMDITSDFSVQHKIVIDTFNSVFREVNPASFSSIGQCINAINDKYLTAFDETTFMIAWKYLNANGHKYELPRVQAMKAESEIDRLMHQYESMDPSIDDLMNKYDSMGNANVPGGRLAR
ncbi:MAG: hypothetical protein IKQ71_02260 [Lachnospiraceae bacterium]|nr:hypothetical protein [Lachnospiraceae bacterium]